MVSENRVLWKKFAFKRERVAEGWEKLSNEELHNFYLHSNLHTLTDLSLLNSDGREHVELQKQH